MFTEQQSAGSQNPETVLRALVGDFNSAPLANGKKMRDLMAMDFEGFRIASISVLQDATDVRGVRYLVTLLWTHELLIPLFSDTTLPKDLSFSVAKTAAKVDPQLHIRLTRFLTDRMLDSQGVDEAAANRLLEILSVLTDSANIQPFLRQMLLHPNARIRSKVTLLIGRGQAGIRALEKLLRDDDARVRANAVEAVWFITDPQALVILADSLQDPNNRVVGNAILGLYFAGDTRSIPAAARLASHPTAVYRATAAWVIGKTKDPRFLPLLGRLLGESQGQLRKTVFSAIDSIKKAAAARAGTTPLQVEMVPETKPPDQTIRICAFVHSPLEWDTPEVKPTDFLLTANSSVVADYSCVEIQHEFLVIGFVLPPRLSTNSTLIGSLEFGLMKCLHARRRTENWGVIRVSDCSRGAVAAPIHIFGQDLSAAPASRVPKPPVPAAYASMSSAIESAIRAPGAPPSAGLTLFDASLALMKASLPSRGSRHLVAIATPENNVDEEQYRALLNVAEAHSFTAHLITTVPNSSLAELCRATSGSFTYQEDPDEIDKSVVSLYKNLRRRFVIEFPANQFSGKLEKLTVQVNRKSDSGEAAWLIQAPETDFAAQDLPESGR